jgi:phage gp45-like
MSAETAGDFRGATVLGVVQAVNDAGQAQTVDVKTHEGIVRAGIEVLQPFGFAGAPPAVGAICLLLAVGGDPGHMVALPVAAPGGRYGGQAAGEATMYGSDGTRVSIRQGSTVEVWAATQVILHTPLATITGNLVVDGDISDAGGAHGTLAEFRTAYDEHKHPDVQPGGSSTGTTSNPTA